MSERLTQVQATVLMLITVKSTAGRNEREWEAV
jgi:hypothetical protein